MLAWGVLAASPLAAQSPADSARWTDLADTLFRNYGPDDGLPISSVTAVGQDGDGFVWVGTQAGLARWDGYHFHVYRSDSADAGALRNDFIWCLQPDRNGRLWIGTNGGGVSRYDRATDRFVTFAADPSDRGSVPVRALAEDESGGMWVGNDRGLDHLGPDGHLLRHYQHDGAGQLPGEQVRALLRDRDGRLWVGTNGGLARQDRGADGFAFVPLGAAGSEPLAVRALLQSSDGSIWIGTIGHGAFVLDSSGKVTALHDKARPELDRLTVLTLAEAAPGTLWMGTDGKGVVAVDAASGRTKIIRHDPTRSSSLPHDLIFSLFRDRSGLLWAGTYSGLGLHDPTRGAVLTVFGGSSQADGLTGADILATLVTRDGTLWVTYLAGGADIFDPTGRRVASLKPDPGHPRASVPPERIRAITQSEDGAVYLGTYRGLYRAGPDGGGVTHLPMSKDTPDPIIISLLGDASGLWIGTYGHGLWRLDYRSGEFRSEPLKALENHLISAIAPAEDGRLWIGTYQGLYLFDPGSERIRQVLPAPSEGRTSSGGLISSLLKDRKGRLWVGTHDGSGIAVIDERAGDDHVRRIGAAQGLADPNVTTLQQDDRGRVWASTGTGMIARIDPDTFDIRMVRRADGIGIRSFAMNSGARGAQGELLFGGDGGMTIIRPDRLEPWTWRPPVVVTDLRVGDRQMPPQAVDGAGQKAPLDILPDSNSLSVEFAALDYSAPDRNRYAYRLEGYDDEWVTTNSTRRLASYTNLPPGHYTLHLRGSNRDGLWSEAPLDIPIEVLPAWYQTLLFRLTVALLAVLAVWMLVRARTSYLRNRQLVLEQQVAQRTAELRQSNSQLAARTAELGQSLRQVAESRGKVASLLDTSGQGFLSFGADLVVEPDYSRACISMLGEAPEGRKANQILFPTDAAKAELFSEIVSGALASDDSFKRDLLLSLLPAATERLNRLLKLEYRRLENGHLMVVLTDVTEERRLSRRIESERLRLAMIVAAVTESRDFFDAVEAFRQFFRQDLMQILAARSEPATIHQEIFRQIHTFKGMLAQFNFQAAPVALQELEEGLSKLGREPGMTAGQIVELVLSVDFHGALETDMTMLRNALGEEFLDQGKRVFLPIAQARQLRTIAERLTAGESVDLGSAEIRQLLEEFRNLDKIALADAVKTFERSIGQVAKRLGKEVAPLSVDGGEDLWLDPELYGPFLRSLIHVFRNAVIHGVEDPEQRLAQGKDPLGRIDCVIRRQGSGFTLTIADDGAGIDTGALRAKAVSLGLMSAELAQGLSDDAAAELVFADMLSGRRKADELAGRGIGLAAVRAETRALGGEVVVTSSAGRGTRFLFSFPSMTEGLAPPNQNLS